MRVVTAIAAALIVLLAPSTALAGSKNQSSGTQGVHVDPGSPSQHEYVLPVSAARNEAAGGGHSSGPGSGSQLFGNGVTPSSGGGGASGGAHGSHPGSPSAGGPSGNGTHASYSLASRSGSSGSNGGGSWVPLAAGGALVLLLGGGGGLALRRRILRT